MFYYNLILKEERLRVLGDVCSDAESVWKHNCLLTWQNKNIRTRPKDVLFEKPVCANERSCFKAAWWWRSTCCLMLLVSKSLNCCEFVLIFMTILFISELSEVFNDHDIYFFSGLCGLCMNLRLLFKIWLLSGVRADFFQGSFSLFLNVKVTVWV